ncbi:MAG TPA: extracellular solute-binding protein [Acetobacteraceae bacterium]|nr:extracellular solute-binding protein [Acetobacteraceae bacterium]
MPSAKVLPHLVAYTGTGLQTDLADRLVEPFAQYMKRKYGVPVRVQNVVGQAPNSWVAFQTEWPHPSGDVYLLYNEYVQQGIPKGYWLPLRDAYTAAEWATFDPGALASMATDGYTAPFSISAYLLVVQNSLGDRVDSWSALGDPKYRNRVTFDSALAVGSGYDAIAAAALVLGADWTKWFANGRFDAEAARPTFEEVARWAKNALTLTEGSGSISPLLRRREALISAWWWQNGLEEEQAGTPVHVVFPKEGVPAAVDTGPVVSSKTRNPVAAFEWVKFFHSATAYKLADALHEYNLIPRRGEPATPQWSEFTKRARIVWINQFREWTLGPRYNRQVLALYNQVVIEGD